MNRTAMLCTLAAFALVLPSAASSQTESGEVQEVLIKVRTDEGDRWYRLGETLEAVDVRPGNYIQFDYADDTIEAVTSPGKETDQPQKMGETKKP